MSKLRAAVVGVGYLGRFHAQKYRALEGVDLVGVCDRDARVGRAVADELGTRCFADYRELAGQVDAVTVAASTAAHFEIAKFLLENGIHVLLEKPMTRTTQEAALLTALAEGAKLKLQVGHVERFNPALLSARDGLTAVSFLECHRLAQFKGRGADVNVILDLMIHDLDVILSLVASKPVSVSAVGIPVLTDDVDIANARIEFENRAIANVTASRASTSAQRKVRVWCPNQYVSIDFGGGEVRRVTRRGHPSEGQAALAEESWNLEKGDALLAETRSFVESVITDRPCVVSGADGLAALELAEWIGAEIAARRAQGPVRP